MSQSSPFAEDCFAATKLQVCPVKNNTNMRSNPSNRGNREQHILQPREEKIFVLDIANWAVTPVTAVTPHVGIFSGWLVYIDVNYIIYN